MKSIFLRVLNYIIPKKSNAVFVLPLNNCEMDEYDIINYTGDSALTLVNYWLKERPDLYGEVYLVIHFPNRLQQYFDYVKEYQHLRFHFLNHSSDSNFVEKAKVMLCRFRSKVWITETVSYLQDYATPKQFQLVLSYFTSCKGDYIFHDDTVKIRKWCVNHSNEVRFISSSFLDSLIKSTAFGPTYYTFSHLGLTRNDNLDSAKPYNESCKNWIDSLKVNQDTKGIIYAPTFRDYETNEDMKSRSVWGFGYDDELINDYLEKQNCIVIAKLHPYQNVKVVSTCGSRIFLYKKGFDFTFYDVMKCADMMITDYSSIGIDWLLLDKPIIYNLYDYDLYKEVRGFAYEPYSFLCGGAVVSNDEELIREIDIAFKSNDMYKAKREQVLDLMYNGKHFDATKKVFDMLENIVRK